MIMLSPLMEAKQHDAFFIDQYLKSITSMIAFTIKQFLIPLGAFGDILDADDWFCAHRVDIFY